MTQAVITRRDGDVFQARMFWLHAARLLDEEGSVIRVGFESGLKGFDDIWVEYDPNRAPQDHFGNSLHIERIQCKWHATPGTFTHEDLTRPEYINATSTSLLQRALEAFRVDTANGQISRLSLVTNHTANCDDPLYRHIRMKSFNLDLDGLFAGKTERSATGRLRKVWRDHLCIDDDELKLLCARLSFNLARESLDMLRDLLDDACRMNGLARPERNASTIPYDSNIFEWVGQRRMVFDRKLFREKCEQEGLLATPKKSVALYGVKSFEHALDRLENRCVRVLNLVPEFNDRMIREETAWRDTLVPKLKEFLAVVPVLDGRMRLAIEVHATLAFAAGAVLNTKSGRLVEMEQRSPAAKIWAPDDESVSPEELRTWEFRELELDPKGSGVAYAISITRDTMAAVQHYINANQLAFRKLVIAAPKGGPSATAVSSGAHANWLAEQLATCIKRDRDTNSQALKERCHLFISAPNAFTFYFGRQAAIMMPLTLYEFDFENQVDGTYRPSLSYPEVAPTG